MGREQRYYLDGQGKLTENPGWMTETRTRRIARPIMGLINKLRTDPVRDGMFLTRSGGSVILASEALSTYTGPGHGPALGEMAAADLVNDPDGDNDIAAG